jgi:Reverse transcriptase (RNA-dependent DNA polymerase)
MNPPDHVLDRTIAQNTRASQVAMFDHAVDTLLQLAPQDGLRFALLEEGFSEFDELIGLTERVIDSFDYTDPAAAPPVRLNVQRAQRQRLKILISLFQHWSNIRGTEINIESVTLADFQAYRIGGFNPEQPFPTFINRGAPLPHNTVIAAGGGGVPPPVGIVRHGPTPAQLFERGIKKDKDHYNEFKDEKHWDNFRRSVETTADTHGTSDILNGTFVPDPTDLNAVALFQSKQRFMYSVWESKIKTDMGMSFVRNHETDRDAQAVWRELSAHQTTSTTGSILRQDLMAHLSTVKLDTSVWRGTHVGFIINFQDKLREFERLTPVADHYTDEMKRTLLEQAVSTIPALAQIKANCQLELVQGRAMPTYTNYANLVKSAAAILDKRMITTKSGRRASPIVANEHDFTHPDPEDLSEDYEHFDDDSSNFNIDTHVHDFEVHRARQRAPFKKNPFSFNRVSLDRETWHNLPEADKAAWDTLSQTAKSLIIQGTRQRGLEMGQTRTPVPPKSTSTSTAPTVPTANTRNTRSAQVTESDAPTLESHNHCIVPSSELLVNLAKSRLPPSDIRAILSQASRSTSNNEPTVDQFLTPPSSPGRPSDQKSTYHAHFHDFQDTLSTTPASFYLRILAFILSCFLAFFYPHHDTRLRATPISAFVYRVSAHESKSLRGSLIDRGANGGIAGNDVRIISTSDRTVDVTGIDNHQLTSIKIGTVGSFAESQRGPVIIIMHQYAIYQSHRSIHSCVQLEHFKNRVDDRSLKAGGLQRITTNDGYVFPLDIIHGLPYLKMRPYTDDEFITLPHVILTSDATWEHNALDCTLSDKDDWYQNTSDWSDGLIDSPFDLDGNYKHLSDPLDIHIHDLLNFNDRYLPLDSDPTDLDVHGRLLANGHLVRPRVPDFESLRPFFLNVPAEVVQHTLARTTQYGQHALSGTNMTKTFRSPFPACNVHRRHEPVATDTVYSDTKAVDTGGIDCAQVFVGRDSLVVDIYGMKSDKQFVNALLEVIRKRGAMDKLISDSAAVEISSRVLDVLRHLMIDSWQSEPYFQHQNFAERRWRDIKRLSNWLMNYKGVPDDCWLLCLEYVADIMNVTAVQSLDWSTPLERLTGQTPDTSIAMIFEFFDEVYYRRETSSFPSTSTECKGRFVGFSKSVGHAMTYKILTTDTRKIIHRSVVRRASDQRNLRIDVPDPLPPPTVIRSKFDSALREGRSLPTIPSIDIDDIYDGPHQLPTGELPHGELPYGEPSNGEPPHGEPPIGEPYDDGPPSPKLDPDNAIGRYVLMPVRPDGQRFRAKILERVDKYKQGLEAKRLENIQYKVLVGHDGGGMWEEVVAYNDLVTFITEDDGDDGVWRFKEILAHQGPLNPDDDNYRGSRWNVLVAWETGELTYEPLKVVQHDKLMCALYARKHNLLNEPGWVQFRKHAKREKKLVRMANQARLHSFRTAPVYMFGHLVPRNHEQAIEIDKQNGNTRWQDAEKEELKAILGYGTFNDLGKKAPPPKDHKRINTHFVYACKHDGRYKARLVAGGHLTDTPVDSVYSSVASLRGVRMVIFLAELNGLNFWSTDIGNAYLESNTMEKVYIVAGKEFACVGLEGHTLVIVKALYGLKSSGVRWWEVLADVLRQMGFKPSRAEKDIWMRRNGDHYEYIVVYVDDLGVAAKDPTSITEELIRRYGFILKGTGPIAYHLGCDYFRDQHGTMCFAPKKYIEKMLETYVRMFGSKPRQYTSPLDKGDHPELDDSEELDLEGTKKFQSMIGAMQWAVQIGRFDIATAVMTLSSFRANPRQGHLDRCKRIYGYLSKMRHAVVRIRVEEPDYSALPNKIYDWEQSVYTGAEEIIPDDIPTALGPPVVMTTFVDANLYHDLVSGKSVTGILHLFNKTVIDWYSKKQTTVETATYGSEYVAARTAMEQIIDLRLSLRYLGVHVKGSTTMFGDNESVVNSSSLPHARLHKRHNALSFHRVREGIAAGIARFHHVPSNANPADILSKQWGYQQAWPLLQPLLFWAGDTMELAPDDTT